MRTERELIVEISRIGRESNSVDEALDRVRSLLAAEIGGSALLIDPSEQGISSWAAKSVSEFLDSRRFPFRGLYTAPLIAENWKAGRLIACFGSFECQGVFLQHLAAHAAQQLGKLLERTRSDVFPRPEAGA